MGLLIRYGKEILKTDCQHTAPFIIPTIDSGNKPQKYDDGSVK